MTSDSTQDKVAGPFDSAQRADYRQMIEGNLLGAITATEVCLD
jgi:hypothetical protein